MFHNIFTQPLRRQDPESQHEMSSQMRRQNASDFEAPSCQGWDSCGLTVQLLPRRWLGYLRQKDWTDLLGYTTWRLTGPDGTQPNSSNLDH